MMKIISIVLYVIGTILLIDSCFGTNNDFVYWTGGIALVSLVLGCIFQFIGMNRKKNSDYDSFN